MERNHIESLATGASIVLAAAAAALMIPASRRLIVNLAEKQLRDFDELEARNVFSRGRKATVESVMADAKKQFSETLHQIGELFHRRGQVGARGGYDERSAGYQAPTGGF